MPPNTTPTIGRRTSLVTQSLRANSTDISDEDHDLSSRQPNSNIRVTSIEVLDYVVKRKTGARTTKNIYGETMFKLSEEMRVKHKSFFNGLGRKLDLSSDKLSSTFVDVSNNIFQSGFNFGRLVSFYAWSTYIIEFCIENNLKEEVNDIMLSTADCLERHITEFHSLGGWDGFRDYFQEPKDSIWQGLLLTTFSFGALAAFLYTKS